MQSRTYELNHLLAKHRASLVKRASYLVGDSGIAEDIVQEAALYVISRIEGFQSEEELVPALYWKIRYLAIDHMRKHKVLEREIELDKLNESSSAFSDTYDLGSDDGQEIVSLALARLSDQQKTALVLTAIEEMSQQQAARRLEISHSAFRQLLARARKGLRQNIAVELERRGWQRADLIRVISGTSLAFAILVPGYVAVTSTSTVVPNVEILARADAGDRFQGTLKPEGTSQPLESSTEEPFSVESAVVEEPLSESFREKSQSKELVGQSSDIESPVARDGGLVVNSEAVAADQVLDASEAEFTMNLARNELLGNLASALPDFYLSYGREEIAALVSDEKSIAIAIGESLQINILVDKLHSPTEILHVWGTLELAGKRIAFSPITEAQQWSPVPNALETSESHISGRLYYAARGIIFGDFSSESPGVAFDGMHLGKDTLQIMLAVANDGQLDELTMYFY